MGMCQIPSFFVALVFSLVLSVSNVPCVADISEASLHEAEVNIKAGHYAQARAVVVPAAKDGDRYAQYLLGAMYLNGAGMSQDIDTAIALIQKSAEQGFPPAQSTLGSMYLLGHYVESDVPRGLGLLRKAAAAGDPEGNYNLGVAYRDGIGMAPDHEIARAHFLDAAKKGHALAQYAMARFCYDAADYSQAIDWYTKAADQSWFACRPNSQSCLWLMW